MTDHPIPEPTPGDTARLDQVAAHWRQLPPADRAAVEQLRATPSDTTGEAVMRALANVGFDTTGEK
ncbi:hypothetical protein [Actinacidiphila yeochonensis]|uniref:hypothetical protein n=1 Tax=Actinacidiphila yeochonensis TaxID=89050 RepID=UPI000569DAE2|nr:hypothetical protein [Actinacidiphila yeochonensis]